MASPLLDWKIPVLDLGIWSMNGGEIDTLNGNQEAETISKEFIRHLEAYGVVHLINHGINFEKLNKLRRVAREFFQLSTAYKLEAFREQSNVNNGWVGKGMEYPGGQNVKGDFKEAYDFQLPTGVDFPWPSAEVLPGFRSINLDFFTDCMKLAKRLLKILEKELEPNSTDKVLEKAHSLMGLSDGNRTQGRCLLYPPLNKKDLEDYDGRLGEHSDWGTFTFLFQDNTGGLEVKDKFGVYHQAIPLEGAILVQGADQLERWTSGRIKSMPHRIRIRPENLHKTRESTVFFVNPDQDCVVKCLDGSDTYEPCLHKDYIMKKMIFIQKDDDTTKEKATSSEY